MVQNTLPLSFYKGNDVVRIAKALVGKVLVTGWGDGFTSGRITETEAYNGVVDKASHAYKGRTARTEVIFGPPGRAYIYLCYGLHQMFNIVTGDPGQAHAILIRAAEPLDGVELMARRTGKKAGDPSIARGPGNLGRAFGFHTSQTGHSLMGPELFIYDDGWKPPPVIGISPRIGVDYAGADAALPYRFYVKGSPFVSGKPRN